MSPYKHKLQQLPGAWRSKTAWRPSDGLVGLLFKLLTRSVVTLWSCLFFRTAMNALEWPSRALTDYLLHAHADETSLDPLQLQWTYALDLYKAIMAFCLVAMYFAVNACCVFSIGHPMAVVIIVASTAFSAGRLLEVSSVVGYLHCDPEYTSQNIVRATFNTLWHYCEAIVAFGVLYASASFFDSTAIVHADPAVRFNMSMLNAGYFSLATITTLGFGDFAPRSLLAKSLVCAEVGVGFYYIVLILQRIGTASPHDDG